MAVVTTNTAANSALRFLTQNSQEASNSIARIASGSRIVRASDDAAGLAISARLSADAAALQQAGTNAAQGASVLQVADGGLARISNVLERLQTLAAQSLSGVPSDNERRFIDAEFQQLLSEINGITATTSFNGTDLLDNAGSLSFFVGTEAGDTISADLDNLNAGGVNTFDASGLGLGSSSVDTVNNASAALGDISTAISTVSESRATLGALVSRFEFRGEQIATTLENIQAANSSIADVDLAREQSALVSKNVLVQASVSALSQANQLPQTLLRVLQ
ncbi:MAG: flagellin [Kiloniellales bacterium]|nr:flagellin [Kiloniellales bacterium]